MKWQQTMDADRLHPQPTPNFLCIRHREPVDALKGTHRLAKYHYPYRCEIMHVDTFHGRGFAGRYDGPTFGGTDVVMGTDQAAWDGAKSLLDERMAEVRTSEREEIDLFLKAHPDPDAPPSS